MENKEVLIIGGGIAGPIAALALRKAGIGATIYEAYATSAEGIGGMLNVAPNGLDALRVVGVELDGIGQPIQRMVIADGRGKRLGGFDGVPGLPPSRVVLRSDLYRLLHEHLGAAGIPIERGKRLVAVGETARDITAHFADGSSARGGALVGADGIRSAVRTLIDPHAPSPQYVGLLGFGGYVSGVDAVGELGSMYFVYGRRAFFGYWPEPGGRMVWFSNLPHAGSMDLAHAREVPAEAWLRMLRAQHAEDVPARDLIDHTSADGLFVLGGMEIMPKVPVWHRGRMVLVGDSAHAPSSSSGQGASLAAESAVELARCLRDLPDVPAAFAAYEVLRRPRVEKIAADAARVNSSKAPGPIGKALMSILMPIAMRTFLKPEKRLGPVHRYRIDWNGRVETTNR
jgi:2-polyprenyl-6-methoxyphenol hydroxylase-like FAD-dependent oxidoreductase